MAEVSCKEIRCLGHDCIRISAGEQIIYTDPYKVNETPHDGTVILITHDHYDHLSREDIEKVAAEGAVLVIPETCDPGDLPDTVQSVYFVKPLCRYEIEGIVIETIPSYNVNKDFHPKKNNWVGYIVNANGLRYYIAGDTDRIPEAEKLKVDFAFLPVGGTYTMTADEAAGLASAMQAKYFVPVHYGIIVGSDEDAEKFVSLVGDKGLKLY